MRWRGSTSRCVVASPRGHGTEGAAAPGRGGRGSQGPELAHLAVGLIHRTPPLACAGAGAASQVRGRFHHSSFLRGGAVVAAGGLSARHGRLQMLTADSGHYWPREENFR